MHREPNAVATDLPPLPFEVVPQPSQHRFAWRDVSGWALASGCLVVIINVCVIMGLRVAFLSPALGFWFLVIQPVYLLYTTSLWGKGSFAERAGVSLTSVLLLLMLAGVIAGVVLPLVGVQRPLDPVPVLVLGDILTVALYLLRRRYPTDRTPGWRLPSLRREEVRLVIGSALCVVMAVLGANRLNNGAGDQVSLATLAVGVVTLVFLLRWRHEIRDVTANVVLYLLSLSLLLMTSLRGWFVTGHDIQTEYQVFQLTLAHGRWDIAAFRNAYNACLSITVLPTELARVTQVDNPYIYKVFFQLIFAACPVLVYTIARRYWPVSTALLASIYFISFPTFFTDMPFINRQEIALLFVAVAILAVTNDSWSRRRRAITLIVTCAGIEVSHYSSMYIFIGILLVTWVMQAVMRLRHRLGHTRAAHAQPPPWARSTPIVDARSFVAICAVAFAWGFLATQSPGSVVTDSQSAISGLLGHSPGARSSNVGYSLFFWRTPTAQQVLDDYGKAALKIRDRSHNTSYIASPDAETQQALPESMLPLTTAGRLLADAGIPVTGLNTTIRLSAAAVEQLFVGVGIIAFLFARRFRKQIGWEFFCLSVGSVAVLGVLTVLPDLSVDYGVLRVFEQSLIIIAPVLVTGSIAMFRALGRVWAPRAAAAVCIGIFISTTGLLPQALGGYPAQLSLNNSGQYYDSYYMHPQEVAGVQWLSGQSGVLPSDVQATHFSDRFLFTAPSKVTGQQFVEDAFPVLLRTHAWVILDYSILHTGVATASYDGDVIPYRYPTGILKYSKNLVYNNGGIEIYR